VVETVGGNVLVADGPDWWKWADSEDHDVTNVVVNIGATVLAWRKP
jgi:hypothetical protein